MQSVRKSRECTMFCRALSLRNYHGILIIILDPYMMRHFKANELLYEKIIFHI